MDWQLISEEKPPRGEPVLMYYPAETPAGSRHALSERLTWETYPVPSPRQPTHWARVEMPAKVEAADAVEAAGIQEGK